MIYITKQQRERANLYQEEAQNKMISFGLKFIALYFGIHFVVGIIRLIFN